MRSFSTDSTHQPAKLNAGSSKRRPEFSQTPKAVTSPSLVAKVMQKVGELMKSQDPVLMSIWDVEKVDNPEYLTRTPHVSLALPEDLKHSLLNIMQHVLDSHSASVVVDGIPTKAEEEKLASMVINNMVNNIPEALEETFVTVSAPRKVALPPSGQNKKVPADDILHPSYVTMYAADLLRFDYAERLADPESNSPEDSIVTTFYNLALTSQEEYLELIVDLVGRLRSNKLKRSERENFPSANHLLNEVGKVLAQRYVLLLMGQEYEKTFGLSLTRKHTAEQVQEESTTTDIGDSV